MTLNEHDRVLLTIVGMGVVTYLPRLLPLLLLSGQNGDKPLPPWLTRWLGYVPVSVLAAMLFPSLLVVAGDSPTANLAWDNLYLWAALPTAWVAWNRSALTMTVSITSMRL